jgi:hypothetical protein
VGAYPPKLPIVQATLIEIFRYSTDCPILADGEGSDDKVLSLLEMFGSMAFGMFTTTFLQCSTSTAQAAGCFGAVTVPTTFPTSPGTSASGNASSTASSAAVPNPTNAGPSTGDKRGLSYNDAALTNAFDGRGMTWAYNWGNSPNGTILSGLEFVPMLWGLEYTSSWNTAANLSISSGSKHLLSFNEPDEPSQSNMDPDTAAKNHITYMNPLAGNGVQIGSPAVTNGAGTNPPMGINWLSQFFAACAGGCGLDFVTFHWYATTASIDDFKQHVQNVTNMAAANGVSKVWLTEFQALGTDSDVQGFLSEALPFLDSMPEVERYAYFMCADGAGDLLSDTSLSAIGEAYAA